MPSLALFLSSFCHKIGKHRHSAQRGKGTRHEEQKAFAIPRSLARGPRLRAGPPRPGADREARDFRLQPGSRRPAPRPVRWADSAPTASFTANCTGRTCGFDSSGSSDDIGIVAWDWNLGDGTTTNGQNVAHVYATAGTYAVTLLVTDTSGQVTGLARLVHVGG